MAMPSSEMNWCGDLQTHPAGQRTGARYPAQASSPLKRCSPRISLAHARKHYILGLVASSKYPYHLLIKRASTALEQLTEPFRQSRTTWVLHSQSLCSGLGAGGPAMQGIALKYL
jgi:hypothetical protein